MGKVIGWLGQLLGLPQLIEKFFAWVLSSVTKWAEKRKKFSEIDENTKGQEENLDKVIKDENATEEQIDNARRDSLDHF